MKKTVIVCNLCETELRPGVPGLELYGAGAQLMRFHGIPQKPQGPARDGSKAFRIPDNETEAALCWECVVKNFGPNNYMER